MKKLIPLFVAAVVAALFAADADLFLWILALVGVPSGAYVGQVAWITGASSGIGEAYAYELARNGATVVLSARRVDRLKAVASRCKELGARDALVEPLDATKISSFQGAVDRVMARAGRLDLLVLNAGKTQRGLAIETDLARVRDIFELNFFGAAEMARFALPHLSANGGGHIVVTSSFTGKVGTPVSSAYSASKHALQGYFNALRTEVAADGVAVTIVCPGPVVSEIVTAANKATGAHVPDNAANKMKTPRAAELMLVATYHRLYEVWISEHPALLFLYLSQYLPSFTTMLSVKGPGRKRVEAYKKGIDLFSTKAYTG